MISAALLICLAPTAYDGDTTNRCGVEKVSIRIWGIAAPEVRPLEPGAAESKANLQTLATGGLNCRFVAGSYHRAVGQCFNGAGVDVGKAQIEGGFAAEDCNYTVSAAYPQGYYGGCP